MVLNNNLYDKLKWVAQYLLPGLATFWLAIAKIWGLPYGTEIGATISAVDVFLGVILGISHQNYDGDGTLVIDANDPDKDLYNLELNIPVEELSEKKTIMFKVRSNTEE